MRAADKKGVSAPFLFDCINTNTKGPQMKDLIDNKTDEQLLQSLIAETAKANSEIKTAQSDIEKANNRIRFILVLANKLINRKEVKR